MGLGVGELFFIAGTSVVGAQLGRPVARFFFSVKGGNQCCWCSVGPLR